MDRLPDFSILQLRGVIVLTAPGCEGRFSL